MSKTLAELLVVALPLYSLLVLVLLIDVLLVENVGKKSELGPADKISRSLGLTIVTDERWFGPSVLYR
jgi:hypothetical protein